MKPIRNFKPQIFDEFGNRIKQEQILPIELSGTVFAKAKPQTAIAEEPKQKRPRHSCCQTDLSVLNPDCITVIRGKAMTTTWLLAKALGCRHANFLQDQVYPLKGLDLGDHMIPTGSLCPKTFWLDKTGVAMVLSHREHSDVVALKIYELLDAAEARLQEQKMNRTKVDAFNQLLEVGKALSDFNNASKSITLTVEQLQELLGQKTGTKE